MDISTSNDLHLDQKQSRVVETKKRHDYIISHIITVNVAILFAHCVELYFI